MPAAGQLLSNARRRKDEELKINMDIPGIPWLVISSQIALFLSTIALVVFTIFIIRQKQSSQLLNNLIGVLTAWITIYLVVALVAWITNDGFGRFTPDKAAGDSTLVFYYLLALLGKFTSLLTYSLIAYYFFHAKRTASLSKRDRIYYQIGFVLLPFIAMPLYYLKIIKGETMRSSET